MAWGGVQGWLNELGGLPPVECDERMVRLDCHVNAARRQLQAHRFAFSLPIAVVSPIF